MLSQQQGYGLLKYSGLKYSRFILQKLFIQPSEHPLYNFRANSWLNVEMPTRCHVWGSVMTRQKGWLKQNLLFPPSAPRGAGLGTLGPTAPQQLHRVRREGEQSESRSKAKALVAAQSICSAWWRGNTVLVWALSSARSLSQSGAGVSQLRSQSPW